MRLADRVAVVTGGTGGIGRSLAARLIEEGAAVVITGRDTRRGTRVAAEIGAHFLAQDATEEKRWAECWAT